MFFLISVLVLRADPCDSLKVTLYPSDTLMCPKDAFTVSAQVNGGIGAYSYQWNLTSENQSAIFTDLGHDTTVKVVVRSVGCPNSVTDSVNVSVKEIKADFRLAPDDVPFVDREFTIENYSVGDNLMRMYVMNEQGLTYTYSFFHEASYKLSLSEPGDYMLKFDIYDVENAWDTISAPTCFDYDTLHITVIDSPQLFIPNAFHPKGQGPNSVFMGVGTHITEYQMKIFGRFGEEVFECNEPGCAWDGRDRHGLLMRPGSYLYHIVATQAGITKEYTGVIHLIY